MNEAKLNPAMLRIARESRGMQQNELSKKLGITSAYVSQLERESFELNPKVVEKISEELKYPVSFFYQDANVVPPNLSYRKRANVSTKYINSIEAHINIYRYNIQFLLEQLKTEHYNLPKFLVEPVAAARELRKRWKIPASAIVNLTSIVEENKIPVIGFDFGTDRVDGRSVFTDSGQPIIFLNNNMPGDRWRYTLAYELGHLVMHLGGQETFSKDVSHEANLFAAELLMPEKEIRKDLKDQVTIVLLGELKRKWKVSMISLLYRANDLEIISDNQKKYLLSQFNEMGIRRREPPELDIPKENTALIKTLISTYKQKKRLTIKQLAETFHLKEEDFMARYN
jgi:Zn-dependent peptidase ImmA (M78 family)/DNA-binding XRE family transcriptional regulator